MEFLMEFGEGILKTLAVFATLAAAAWVAYRAICLVFRRR